MQINIPPPYKPSILSNLVSGFIGLMVLGLLFVLIKACSGWVFDTDDNFNLNATTSVVNCLSAIEDRNWENYVATFEPSTVLHPTSPGLSVHFVKPQATVMQQGERTAVIQIKAIVKIDGTDSEWPLNLQVHVVKVNRANISGELGMKKWYIAAPDVQLLPFNFSY
jgi:hypothetical protein